MEEQAGGGGGGGWEAAPGGFSWGRQPGWSDLIWARGPGQTEQCTGEAGLTLAWWLGSPLKLGLWTLAQMPKC